MIKSGDIPVLRDKLIGWLMWRYLMPFRRHLDLLAASVFLSLILDDVTSFSRNTCKCFFYGQHHVMKKVLKSLQDAIAFSSFLVCYNKKHSC